MSLLPPACLTRGAALPAALGGSPLTAWDPTDGSEAGLYDNMVSCVAAAGVPKPKGVLWYQVLQRKN